jgi:RNA polymerase sigma factor (TIGR02999 family)
MSNQITRILRAMESGEPKAAEELLPLVYEELRALAARRMAQERPGATLQATALVHEAWLRLEEGASNGMARWMSSAHFFRAAAEAMRRILIERARARGAQKRGGRARRENLDPEEFAVELDDDGLLDLDEALRELAEQDERKARLVELRFFAGLPLYEAGRALGISAATADRDWAFARAWLYARLGGAIDAAPAPASNPPAANPSGE